LTAFTPERLARALRFLREARFGTLVTHLFALRVFLPNAIGDAHCGALQSLQESLHEELDRLFIKLRLPNYAISARDVETPSLRATIERVLTDAGAAHGMPGESPTATVALRGSFLPHELSDFAERLSPAELAGALPWAALARLMPDETAPAAQYRARLIESFDALCDGETNDFLDALARQHDAALDGALDALATSLHATAQ
jgi:hypothetical protein